MRKIKLWTEYLIAFNLDFVIILLNCEVLSHSKMRKKYFLFARVF